MPESKSPVLNLLPIKDGSERSENSGQEKKNNPEVIDDSKRADLEKQARQDTTVEIVNVDKEKRSGLSDTAAKIVADVKKISRMDEKEFEKANKSIQILFDDLNKILEKGAGPASLKELQEYLDKAGNTDSRLKEDLMLAIKVLKNAMEEHAKKPAGPAPAPQQPPVAPIDTKGMNPTTPTSGTNPYAGEGGIVLDRGGSIVPGSFFAIFSADKQHRTTNQVRDAEARDWAGNKVVKADTHADIVEAQKEKDKDKKNSGASI